jgi:shikimate kinase
MSRVLLSGMSGTGKSSVIGELRRMGFTAIDMDEPGWSVHDAEGHQLWCEERLQAALAAEPTGLVFVSGCAENQVKFYPRFTHIVLLSAPADVIRDRLADRTNTRTGSGPKSLRRSYNIWSGLSRYCGGARRTRSRPRCRLTKSWASYCHSCSRDIEASPAQGRTRRCTRPAGHVRFSRFVAQPSPAGR